MTEALEAFIARDVAAYKTAAERAAYRAGMSTAATICDHVKLRVEMSNSSPRGRVTQMGTLMGAVAETCGDEITKARERIEVSGN